MKLEPSSRGNATLAGPVTGANALTTTASIRFGCVARAWQAHERELRGYLRHRLSDGHAAEDLVQEVFMRAMRAGHGFCALANPRAWLFQVARNVLVDEIRRRRPHEPATDELALFEPEPLAPVDELATCLMQCMERLGTDDRDILRACDLDGQTVRAFAEASHVTLPAAKSRLLRARQRLRDLITTSCQVRFDADGTVAGHGPSQLAQRKLPRDGFGR